MPKIVNGAVKIKGRTLKLRRPVKSWAKNKKKVVAVRVPGTNKAKLVHFGHTGYQDFRQHGSKKRRKSYCARSAGIKGGKGELSPNTWARRMWSC
jgi:hypothetical protein